MTITRDELRVQLEAMAIMQGHALEPAIGVQGVAGKQCSTCGLFVSVASDLTYRAAYNVYACLVPCTPTAEHRKENYREQRGAFIHHCQTQLGELDYTL